MPVMGVARFERFFRAAASLDVDKNDLKRYNQFVNDKLYDMFLIARALAKANSRDVILAHDLPITKGLRESMHEFDKLDQGIELRPILNELAARPPLDIVVGGDAEERLPRMAGGLSVALARMFKIIDPKLRNPRTDHWNTAFRVFDLLL